MLNWLNINAPFSHLSFVSPAAVPLNLALIHLLSLLCCKTLGFLSSCLIPTPCFYLHPLLRISNPLLSRAPSLSVPTPTSFISFSPPCVFFLCSAVCPIWTATCLIFSRPSSLLFRALRPSPTPTVPGEVGDKHTSPYTNALERFGTSLYGSLTWSEKKRKNRSCLC